MNNLHVHRYRPTRVAHWFVAAVLAARLLYAAEVPSANTPLEESPALAEEFLKVFKDPTSGSIYEISNRIELQLDQAGGLADKSALELLGIKQEFVAHRMVLELLDKLVEQERGPLAAKLLIQIARAKLVAQSIEPPNVIVGQLIVEDGQTDPTLVMAQMPILEDGYFAGDIGQLERPITFRAHGYEDLNVPLKDKDGDVAYVGQVKLVPLAKDRQASLKGQIALDGTSCAESAVVTLSVAIGPINTRHNGYAPRRRWPEGIQVAVSESGEFQVDGLNPSDYNVIVSAYGHVDLHKKVTLTAGQQLESDSLRLFSSDLGFYIGKAAPTTSELAWEPDFDIALRRAQSEKKPLLVMMTATWCGPCKLLEEQTLNDVWIRHFLSPFVLVKAYEDREVEKKYGLRGYPTLVFMDSSGKAVHSCVGHMPAFSFAAHCAQALQGTSIELPSEIETLIEKNVIMLP